MRDVLGEEPLVEDKGNDVDEELAAGRKRRTFNEENWFYRIRIVSACAISFLVAVLVIIYFWHIAGPCCRWLTEVEMDRLERLTTTVIAGVVASLSVSYIFKR